MVRIRVKINSHDGVSKKPSLIQTLCDAETSVNKIIETKEAFFLVTDNKTMDKLLKEEIKEIFASRGLEIEHPPELEAARTVILRNVDSLISSMTEGEILGAARENLNDKRVIKIPNSSHLLKIIFGDTVTADRVVEKGLKIHFQLFEGKSIETEVFVAVVPCYRCYSYEHLKKHCPKDDSYKVCSNCGIVGHIFTDCKSNFSKCLNCEQAHRTLAAKCPVRNNIIKKKIKEKRERSRSVSRGKGGGGQVAPTPASVTRETLKAAKLPENYLAVMAAAITLAEKREAEVPGIYQYIISEMLRANGIPDVIFPDSVIKDYKQNYEVKQREDGPRK